MKLYRYVPILTALLLMPTILGCAAEHPWQNVPLSEHHAHLQEDIRYIIHAAGEIDGMKGSNSLEALDATYVAGCCYVELDFQFTADGELACVHNWHTEYSSAMSEDGTPMTLAEFQSCRIYDRYTPLCLDSLADYMITHPELYIITDIKEGVVAGAERIAEDYPDLVDRFIIQIYEGDEYDPVREAGFENIIYTLYQLDWQSKTDTKALVRYAKTHPLLAYTFAYELCEIDGCVAGMQKAGVPLYVHTVNGAEQQQVYFDMGIAGVYTDERNS